MRHTKIDLARVIVTALYNKPALVAADHPEVVRRARRGTVESLTRQHKLAVAAIMSVQHPAAASGAAKTAKIVPDNVASGSKAHLDALSKFFGL